MNMQLLKNSFLLMLFFLANTALAQDIITLKNGDEIKSKVIEVTPDFVKYKNWVNQDGPIYTASKSEVFMIKYINGTKDVFKTTQITNVSQNNTANDGSKFIGVWHDKYYNGANNKSELTITTTGSDLLVDNVVHVSDGLFYNTDGSFKQVGHMEGNSLIINSFLKLSLLNDNTILMGSKEYYKARSSNNTPTNNKEQSANHVGYYNNYIPNGDYKIVDQAITYKSNSAEITSVSFDGGTPDSKNSDIKVLGKQILTCNLSINGFKNVDERYNYTFSACTTYTNGEVFEHKENLKGSIFGEPFVFTMKYGTPYLINNSTQPVDFYLNFIIFDNNSDAKIQGFLKFTLVP